MLPGEDRADQIRDEHDVDRAIAYHLIRDRHVAAPRVLDLWPPHSGSLTEERIEGQPFPTCVEAQAVERAHGGVREGALP
jgi:hypothetical protein